MLPPKRSYSQVKPCFNSGKLHSPEHDRHFDVQDGKLQLYKEKDNPKLHLSINGQNIADWFKQKYQELKQSLRPHIKPLVKPEMTIGNGPKM
ncbi:MAG: hypothetical protein LBR97_02810 [Dysgonamonadaceae bacterium]|jgi:hypothetical protein|nr:hypothetical protein [Dysgonamonadaceae bacterium]